MRNPEQTIPRAIQIALALTVLVCGAVALIARSAPFREASNYLPRSVP